MIHTGLVVIFLVLSTCIQVIISEEQTRPFNDPYWVSYHLSYTQVHVFRLLSLKNKPGPSITHTG